MSWINSARHLYQRLLHGRRVEEDLDREVQSYFETMVERGMARGLSREEARRAAQVAFESPENVKEKVRAARVGATMETTLQDVRYAWRVLQKSPGFTFFAVLTIALGLGANAAIFSLVDGALLKSSGYPEPERIVELWEKPPGGMRNAISPANYIDWSRQNRLFESMAASTFGGSSMSYTGGGEPRSLHVFTVSAPYFDVFGVRAALGRTFAKDEDQLGKEKVAVLTNRLWVNLFGADPSMIGRQILLNGNSYTVIGVLPAGGQFDRGWEEIFVPLAFPAQVARDYHYLKAVGRLKPGVSVQQAQAEMSAIAGHIAELYPAIKKGWGATLDRYVDRLIGPQTHRALVVLMWAVAAVLLIACANLANLLMARATLRSREIALRTALGAGRGRVVRMLLTESLLLSVFGAIAGIGLGYELLRWIQALLGPFYFPREVSIGMDGRVLLFLSAVTLLTGIAFGLAPAIQATGANTADALRESGRTGSASRAKLSARYVFVAAQVATAFILLVGGGLLIRSFESLMHVDTGFDSQGLLAADFPLDMQRSPDPQKLKQYIGAILDQVRAIPGMQAAAITTGLPLQGWGDGMPFRLPDKKDTHDLGTGFKIVTPGYFHALRLRVLAGRILDDRDTSGSPLVIVANQSFVKRFFPTGNPIGKRILVDRILPSRHGLGPEAAWEIVGVVADEKGNGLDSPTDEGVYASFDQSPVVGLGLVVRGSGEATALIKSVERAVWSVNKNQVLDNPTTVERIKSDSLMSRRLPTVLLGGFAFLALLLACAGIYGVLSFVTARRTQEFGIRAALGASRGDLVCMVVGGGALPVLAGIGAGLGGALWLTRFLQSMLFGIRAIDAPTLTVVSILFLVVSAAACVVPAWRAARIDPMLALRQE